MSAFNILQKHAFIALTLSVLCNGSTAGIVYVDNSHSGPFLGTSANPYAKLSDGVSNSSPGDTIYIYKGDKDYNVTDNGESFPFVIPAGLTLIGQETTVEQYPRIGGDVNSSDSLVKAVFSLDASTYDRNGITLQKVRIVAEDYTLEAAPSAILIQTAAGKTANSCVIDNVIIERLAQNCFGNPEVDGRAPILVHAGWGSVGLTISNCEIEANERGGVEVLVGSSAYDESHKALITTDIKDSLITNTSDDESAFGILHAGVGEVSAQFDITIDKNVIDATRAEEGGGIREGVVLFAMPEGEHTIKLSQTSTPATISRITIKGCLDAGVVLRSWAVDVGDSIGFIHDVDFRNNVVQENSTGVLLDYGDTAGGTNDIHIGTNSNLIVNNTAYGVQMIHDADEGDNGYWHFSINDTIANNDSYGIHGLETPFERWPTFWSAIVYYNNGGGGDPPSVQYYGTDGWSPEDHSATYFGANYSCWEDLDTAEADPYSIGDSPVFVSISTMNYHLHCDSPCIDAGTNSTGKSGPARADIDGEDRIQPEETGWTATVDMGADELITDSCAS